MRAPAGGLPLQCAFVDINRIELLQDAGGDIALLLGGSVDRQHEAAATHRFRIAVGMHLRCVLRRVVAEELVEKTAQRAGCGSRTAWRAASLDTGHAGGTQCGRTRLPGVFVRAQVHLRSVEAGSKQLPQR